MHPSYNVFVATPALRDVGGRVLLLNQCINQRCRYVVSAVGADLWIAIEDPLLYDKHTLAAAIIEIVEHIDATYTLHRTTCAAKVSMWTPAEPYQEKERERLEKALAIVRSKRGWFGSI